jgi:hypothetical protein
MSITPTTIEKDFLFILGFILIKFSLLNIKIKKSHLNTTKLKGLKFPKEIRNFIAGKCKLRKKWHQS